MARWKSWVVSLLWVAALLGTIVVLVNPGGPPPPPPGWTIWREMGGIRAIAHAPDGTYAGGLIGLFKLSKQGNSRQVSIPGLGANPLINAMLVDRDGRMLVGHNKGLSIWDGKSWQTYDENNGLPSRFVAGLVEAADGSIWVAMHGGAARLPRGWLGQPEAVKQFFVEDGLPHNHLQAVNEDAQGGIWFGSYAVPDGGVARYHQGVWQTWLGKDGLPHPNVTAFLPVRGGQVWAGFGYYQEGGAAMFSPGLKGWELAEVAPKADLAGPKVRSLYEDDKGRLWLGHEYDGISVLKNNKVLRYVTMDDGLPAREVMTMHTGPDGAFWLGTLNGVARLTPQAVEALFEM